MNTRPFNIPPNAWRLVVLALFVGILLGISQFEAGASFAQGALLVAIVVVAFANTEKIASILEGFQGTFSG